MAKQKKKLTLAQKAAKKERQKKYMTVFMNGKQVKVKRSETIDGIDVDEFIRRNADPIWLHQKEMWEYIPFLEELEDGLYDSHGHLCEDLLAQRVHKDPRWTFQAPNQTIKALGLSPLELPLPEK